METKLMISLFLFIAFSIVGIIGEDIENNKTIKLCFKLIKILAYIGIAYNLVCICLSMIK